MPAPAFALKNMHATAGNIGRPTPQNADLEVNYALLIHRRSANSALHNWLREKIAGTISDLDTLGYSKFHLLNPADDVTPG
ncbi:MAG: hypothetical protein ACI9NT_002010 [Bacteroidia bacterium]|jgi:hypothetical protein